MLQSSWEFAQLLDIYKKSKPQRVLEIGVKNGGTLYRWINHAIPGTVIVAVDDCKQEDIFNEACEWANSYGLISFEFLKGDSHNQEIIDEVRSFGPYDFVFIDGDHTYEGVREDWENFGNAGLVAFHDIVPHLKEEDNGAFLLWREIKKHYPHVEIVESWFSNFGGIGVIAQSPEFCDILSHDDEVIEQPV